jgi:hypothetical protein
MSSGRSVWVEMFSGRSVGGRSVQAPLCGHAEGQKAYATTQGKGLIFVLTKLIILKCVCISANFMLFAVKFLCGKL